MQLNDPVHNERVPAVGNDSLAAPGDCFTATPLSRTAIGFLKRSLVRNQLRRKVYCAGELRVYIDGEERWQFDPRGGICEPFSIPLGASYMDIFGDDNDGGLLLAVFPLPAPSGIEADGAQQLFVRLEGGQTLAVEVSLCYGTCSEVSAYVVQISYSESAEVDTRRTGNPAIEPSLAVLSLKLPHQRMH